jgi:hypothetical protein
VGHKFGAILIKRLIIEVNKVAHRKKCDVAEKEAKDRCEVFQHNLSGIIFYSVPHFMTATDIHIMFGGKDEEIDGPRSENYYQSTPSSSQIKIHHASSAWQALSHQIEAINEDFEYSIAHDHTRICVISHGLTKERKVNSLKLHHVLDGSHINIFCSRAPIWKKLIKCSSLVCVLCLLE